MSTDTLGSQKRVLDFSGNGVTYGGDIPDMDTWELNLDPSAKVASSELSLTRDQVGL